jgi:hypothetical protein
MKQHDIDRNEQFHRSDFLLDIWPFLVFSNLVKAAGWLSDFNHFSTIDTSHDNTEG